MIVELHAGEMLYLPASWFHEVIHLFIGSFIHSFISDMVHSCGISNLFCHFLLCMVRLKQVRKDVVNLYTAFNWYQMFDTFDESLVKD